MKKNKMMRLASAMMVLTLMSTSVISGTFAKYVTSDSATDTARVAKWGVTVTAEGSLFAETYKKTDNTPGDGNASVSVVSSGPMGDNVVAPGTKNEDGITFAITGEPEVAVRVSAKVEDAYKYIYLGVIDGLPKTTTTKADDNFNVSGSDYEPVRFTLSLEPEGSQAQTLLNKVTMKEIAEYLNTTTWEFDANNNLANEFGALRITWEWDFDHSGAGTYDDHDTLLGDLAAGKVKAVDLPDGTKYSTETEIEITVSVTQID